MSQNIEINLTDDIFGSTIKINDQEIEKVRSISVRAEVGEVPVVTIEIIGGVKIIGKSSTVQLQTREYITDGE